MIKQAAVSTIKSRSHCNVYNENDFLPLIVSPMYSVISEKNYRVYLDKKIQVCLPRQKNEFTMSTNFFSACSIEDFKYFILEDKSKMSLIHSTTPDEPFKMCIDTANGNMKILHDIIREAKTEFGKKLLIMAGNVGSVDAFEKLAETGCDYIRVGIGGGGSCTTSTHTGVGQKDLKDLVSWCHARRLQNKKRIKDTELLMKSPKAPKPMTEPSWKHVYEKQLNVINCKIVADGISSYIKKSEFHRNGYAAINNLLYSGANMVMIGTIFAKCLESAGNKFFINPYKTHISLEENQHEKYYRSGLLKSVVRGMSTQEEQVKYKCIHRNMEVGDDVIIKRSQNDFVVGNIHKVLGIGDCTDGNNSFVTLKQGEKINVIDIDCVQLVKLKPSEGKTVYVDVEYTIDEWLNGKQSEPDTFPGFIPMLQSAMSYTNSLDLTEFKERHYA